MAAIRRAVIDIGTNSVKLLVADVAGGQVVPVLETSHQTRLGQGFYENRVLQPAPVAETAAAVADFVNLARRQAAVSVRAIGTSAAREATNAGDLLEAVAQACGLVVEIISGTQEADWAFRGVTTDPALAAERLLLLEVGGGSTEFVVGQGSRREFEASFPLGTVRLMSSFAPGDPPRPDDLARCRARVTTLLREQVRPAMNRALDTPLEPGSLTLIGTGGTSSIVARIEARLDHYDRARMEALRLTRARLTELVNRLWSLPLEARKQIVGLPPNRADVILFGTVIYEMVLAEFGFSEWRVSTRGLRFAALLDGPPEASAVVSGAGP